MCSCCGECILVSCCGECILNSCCGKCILFVLVVVSVFCMLLLW